MLVVVFEKWVVVGACHRWDKEAIVVELGRRAVRVE